jgi:hypothetical protein
MDQYTAESVRASIAPKWDVYYAKLAIGQPTNWKCDDRTKENFCLTQWITDECSKIGCNEVDMRDLLRRFNRHARADNDLYQTAADVMNSYLNQDIIRYEGLRRH